MSGNPPAPRSNFNYGELQNALTPLFRQLERLEERLEARTQDLVTRKDLDSLRHEVVARDSLEPQLQALRNHIERIEKEWQRSREEQEKELEELKKEQINRAAMVWLRIGPLVALAAFLLSFFEFLSRIKFIP